MIGLRNITLRFGEKIILDDFSVSLPERGVVCLSGPSGCGKTTLARILAHLETPESGSIEGLCAGQTAFLFQEDRLLPWLSVMENLTAVCSRETAGTLLHAVGLSPEAAAKPAELSGGMRRRVALARALAFDSRVLILDEPFNGIDETTKSLLYPLIQEYAKNQLVVLITHHSAEIEALADHVLRLDGPPLRILSDHTI